MTAPASTTAATPITTALPQSSAIHAPDGRGLLRKLLAAFHAWRVERRMRNLASGMDPYILKDVGVPDWVLNEATVQRELSRARNVEYLRW